MTHETKPRRRFLAAAAGAAAAAVPVTSSAQSPTVNWRFQSAWPATFLYHEFAVDWCRKVADLSGGRIKIEMLPAGSVVPALQIIDAISKGVLDGGHGLPGFWFGKNTAFGLYGAGPDFGMNGEQMLGWIEYGGGKQLYAEVQAAANLDIVSFLYGQVPCEPLGWFKKEIKSPADIKGLKFRTAGLAVDMYKELGAAAVQMAPPDIVPAMDRGVLDGAEFASASDDKVMGFADVAKFYLQQSYHMANNFCEMMVNKKKFEALSPELKMILKYASDSASADMNWKSMDRMSADFLEIRKNAKVSTTVTPQSVLDAQLGAWNAVIARRSAENPLFAKIVESQKAWAQRVVYWHNTIQVSPTIAYAHYFGKGPAV
ncbi:TRAP transporter substrate-binding protein [soil metagenome]